MLCLDGSLCSGTPHILYYNKQALCQSYWNDLYLINKHIEWSYGSQPFVQSLRWIYLNLLQINQLCHLKNYGIMNRLFSIHIHRVKEIYLIKLCSQRLVFCSWSPIHWAAQSVRIVRHIIVNNFSAHWAMEDCWRSSTPYWTHYCVWHRLWPKLECPIRIALVVSEICTNSFNIPNPIDKQP